MRDGRASAAEVSVQRVELQDVLDLRTRVFRPLLQGVRPYRVPLDEARRAGHFALYHQDGEVVGVVSFLPESPASRPEGTAFRVFGCCIASAYRGRGLGGQLFVEGLTLHADTVGSSFEAWGWTRESKTGFWRRFGFKKQGQTKWVRQSRYFLMGASSEILFGAR